MSFSAIIDVFAEISPPSATTLASAVNAIPPLDFNVTALTPPDDDATFDATFWLRLNEMPKFNFPAWLAVILKATTPAG